MRAADGPGGLRCPLCVLLWGPRSLLASMRLCVGSLAAFRVAFVASLLALARELAWPCPRVDSAWGFLSVFSCVVGMTLRAPCFGAFGGSRLGLLRGVLMGLRPPSVGRALGLC